MDKLKTPVSKKYEYTGSNKIVLNTESVKMKQYVIRELKEIEDRERFYKHQLVTSSIISKSR